LLMPYGQCSYPGFSVIDINALRAKAPEQASPTINTNLCIIRLHSRSFSNFT